MKASILFGVAALIVGFVVRLPQYPCPAHTELLLEPTGGYYESSCVKV